MCFLYFKKYVNVTDTVLSQFDKIGGEYIYRFNLEFNGIILSSLQNGLKQICGSWNDNKTLKQGKLFVRYCTINSDSLHDS